MVMDKSCFCRTLFSLPSHQEIGQLDVQLFVSEQNVLGLDIAMNYVTFMLTGG